LIGRRKWDDPEVLSERNILLGPNDQFALAFVNEKREKLVKKFLKAFYKLESIEREAFGENSFFFQRNNLMGSCGMLV
jgi:hypothetical protein